MKKGKGKIEANQIIKGTIKNQQVEDYDDNFDELLFDTFFYDFNNIELSRIKTDNYGDGGADYIFFINNGQYILSSEDVDQLDDNAEVEIHFIQIKETDKLDSAVPTRLIELTRNFFKYEKPDHYNEEIIANIELFQKITEKILPKGRINVIFYYFGLFDKHQLDNANDLTQRFETLKNSISDHDFVKNSNYKIYTSSDIFNSLSKEREYEYHFKKIDKYSAEVNEETDETEALISLIPIQQFYDFIKDDDGGINTKLFEHNIRDYKGKSNVNKDIINTLEERKDLQFWWLNNGITIIAEEINESSSAKKITIKNPQIVNGLQTSYSIFNYFQENNEKLGEENRSVFIKIIRIDPEEEGIELDITKATNRQNEIRDKDIRANDEVQKNIELHFKTKGKFYQRKDKYYTNRRMNKKDIITLFDLAKYVYTIMFKDPVFTRNNPGKLLKDDKYNKIFKIDDPKQDYDIYYRCYKIYDSINLYNKGNITIVSDQFSKSNFVHHIVYICMSILQGNKDYDPNNIKTIKLNDINEDLVNTAYKILSKVIINNNIPGSQILKNIKEQPFLVLMKKEIDEYNKLKD
ncbi:AIPR family protein [Mammaliicoccus sp. FSL K6-3158]|uniref:AIPR family protein n=1 Tax=Mammaliicoccus sp. FSL K6-3158 TaxID=2921491 RepID=UPI0030FABEE0